MKENQRIEWIDMAKGYGIIFVLIGHCDMPILTDYIYAFHIPLFFFLSGYVYNIKYDFATFTSNKVRRMVIPYFCLCIPMIFCELYFGDRGTIDLNGILSETYDFVLQERHTTLWYLSTLILLVFVMYPIVKLNIKYQVVFVIASSICGLLLWKYKILALPWNFDAVLVVLPFFFAGYYVRKRYGSLSFLQSDKTNALLASMAFTIITIFITYWNLRLSGNKVDIFFSTFGIEWLSYIAAYIGIFACILFSMLYINNIISYIGRHSLLFFAWHQSIIIPLLSHLYWKTGISSWPVYQETTLFKWITIVLTIIILSIINEFILQSKLKFVLGK